MSKQRISPEETRTRLIDAGLHLFGVKGFEATRTRELSSRAGVNQAAIPYHFGGKEGLYLAVAQVVVERGKKDLQERFRAVREAIGSGGLTRQAAGRLLLGFLTAFLDRIVMAEDIGDRSRFMMREYSSPGAGFDVIYDGFLVHVHRELCRLVGRIVGKDPESESVIIRTHSVMGTAISMVVAKALLLRRLGWDDYTPDRMAEINKIVSEVVASGLQLEDLENPEEAP